jgi:hypothetical protein
MNPYSFIYVQFWRAATAWLGFEAAIDPMARVSGSVKQTPFFLVFKPSSLLHVIQKIDHPLAPILHKSRTPGLGTKQKIVF